jgi:hypothetical protein
MHPIMYRMFFFCDCDFVHYFVFTLTDYMEAKYENNSGFFFVTTNVQY